MIKRFTNFGRCEFQARIFTATAMITALFNMAACSDDDGNPLYDKGAPLSITVNTQHYDSRALIESTTFPSGSQIGLTLLNASGAAYDGKKYQNIKATSSGTGSSQTWTLASKVLLSGTSGTLYAYYPYSSTVTDIASVPVAASASNQTDYMYATPVTGLHDGNHEAAVGMKHALAAIRLNIVRGTYTGTGAVTSVSIQGDNIATAGTLNAKTGALSSLSGTGSAITLDQSMTISTTAQTADIIFVPLTTTSASPSFTATIDGKDYTVTADATKFAQSNIYTYTLTVNAKDMELSDVTIGEWGYNDSGNPVINAGYKITLENTNKVFIKISSNGDGNGITISARAGTDLTEYPRAVTYSGDATVTQTVTTSLRQRNISIKDINSDVTISFNGNTNAWGVNQQVHYILLTREPLRLML